MQFTFARNSLPLKNNYRYIAIHKNHIHKNQSICSPKLLISSNKRTGFKRSISFQKFSLKRIKIFLGCSIVVVNKFSLSPYYRLWLMNDEKELPNWRGENQLHIVFWLEFQQHWIQLICLARERILSKISDQDYIREAVENSEELIGYYRLECHGVTSSSQNSSILRF